MEIDDIQLTATTKLGRARTVRILPKTGRALRAGCIAASDSRAATVQVVSVSGRCPAIQANGVWGGF